MRGNAGKRRGGGTHLGDRVGGVVGVLLGDLVVLVERIRIRSRGGGGLLLLDSADGLGARDDLVGAAVVAEGVEARDDAEGLPRVFIGVVAPDDEEGGAAALDGVRDDLLHNVERGRLLGLLGDLGDGGARGEARELLSRGRRQPAREGAGGGDAGARALRRGTIHLWRCGGGGGWSGRVGAGDSDDEGNVARMLFSS